MSDNIPFDIQGEIMKRLPVKSLLQFRSVSKTWKSLIDSSKFIAAYQHTELQQNILVKVDFEHNYVSVADDDTFPRQKVYLPAPMFIKTFNTPAIAGCSKGLFCFYDYFEKPSDSVKKTAVIWNPTIRKSVTIDVSNVLDRDDKYTTMLGFGVCPHTLDPMLVKISIETGHTHGEFNTFIDTTWRVEVFRLSSWAWKRLSINLPRSAVVLYQGYDRVQVVIDRFIYWLAFDRISRLYLIISFDMISEEFTDIHLPDNLTLNYNSPYDDLHLRKFNGSLVMLEHIVAMDVPQIYHVWMMENGDPKSFIKLYTIKNNKPNGIVSVFGFRKIGKPLVAVRTEEEDSELSVYDPKLDHFDYTGISAKVSSFYASAYTETLLLLDH